MAWLLDTSFSCYICIAHVEFSGFRFNKFHTFEVSTDFEGVQSCRSNKSINTKMKQEERTALFKVTRHLRVVQTDSTIWPLRFDPYFHPLCLMLGACFLPISSRPICLYTDTVGRSLLETTQEKDECGNLFCTRWLKLLREKNTAVDHIHFIARECERWEWEKE